MFKTVITENTQEIGFQRFLGGFSKRLDVANYNK
jgi:hypothetical protein